MSTLNAAEIAALIIVVMAITAVGCSGYVPGRQAYWDNQLRQMCETDGLVRILERVALSKGEADSMPRTEGKIALRVNTGTSISQPVYAEVAKTTYLRRSSPEVRRDELVAVRRSDQKIVARWVEYSRVGGDLPTGIAHESSFHCPDPRQVLAELQPLFVGE
jgi:hypothetical protein